ncbi:carboxypeptidase Q-like [Anopheles ziemanni]|uniref:carboxypeptidase Q-like n=1 Tax=Anopheles ziemanni TaxID=345580 RepID=UPI002658B9DA|nr:carboxypeptidase Q isoform X2 [Anopheles coustani]XP_058174339.1 carboxypeptidase Q-like [Anopheles ziemanni]
MERGRVFLFVVIVAIAVSLSPVSAVDEKCDLPRNLRREIKQYQPVVDQIFERIVSGEFAGKTWESLLDFTDRFGPRLTGSKQLEDAIDFAVKEMINDGLENVHTEDALVPHWERGREWAQLVEPFRKNLPMLGLGGAVGTPPEGIMAEVIAVESFEEFESFSAEQVQGKIVVFAPAWVGYGPTGIYRGESASVAAKKGAIGVLVRSMTPFSIGTPHTGTLRYDPNVRRIPAAAITVEDAMLLLRKFRRGDRMVVHLKMDAVNLEPTISRNTIGELQGSTVQNTSVVVVSGHMDSWDVGTGASDDAGGVFISWKAVAFLKAMGLRPKRTIRAIAWTAEEQGLEGVSVYERQHAADEREEFNVFFESDSGTYEPTGLDFSGNPEARCIFAEIAKLMRGFSEFTYTNGTVGSDIGNWVSRGFPGVSLRNKNDNYFWYHHSEGDTIELEDPEALDKSTALWAATAYVIADLSIDIPKAPVVYSPRAL